jgi:hypothetical protein
MAKTKNEKGKNSKLRLQKMAGWALFILIVAQVVLANSLVSKGREINRLISERERLRAEVVSLENNVARASSLTAIRQEAEGLGMVPGSIEFLPPPPIAAAP